MFLCVFLMGKNQCIIDHLPTLFVVLQRQWVARLQRGKVCVNLARNLSGKGSLPDDNQYEQKYVFTSIFNYCQMQTLQLH